MSAKDVASNMPATPRRPGSALRVLAALLPFAGGIAGAFVALRALDEPRILPEAARYVCAVINAHGAREDIFGVTAEAARERASRVISAPDADVRAIRERLAGRDAEWRAMSAGPLPALAPAAECAALLRARADLALALAGPGATSSAMPTPWLESNTLDEADRAVEEAVWLENPASLRRALRAADAAEGVWLAEPLATARVRLVRWRERERSRAEQFQLAAADIEIGQTAFQGNLMSQWQPQMALELEASALTPLAVIADVGPAPAAVPFAPVWAIGIVAGLLTGAIPGSLVWVLMVRIRRRTPGEPRDSAAARRGHPPARSSASASTSRRVRTAPAPRYLPAPTPSDAWLHLVSARGARGIALTACEVAGPFVARGERVLIVDAGRRLKLHDYFGCAPHWGLGECVRGEMPLLGSVQRAGVSGLYLLARGDLQGDEQWKGLGDVIDDAHRHFGTVVLALEADTPHAASAMLGGRVVEAWWGNTGRRLPRVLESLTARVGIVFTPFTLTLPHEDLLEALSERVERLRIASLLAMLDAAEPAAPNLPAPPRRPVAPTSIRVAMPAPAARQVAVMTVQPPFASPAPTTTRFAPLAPAISLPAAAVWSRPAAPAQIAAPPVVAARPAALNMPTAPERPDVPPPAATPALPVTASAETPPAPVWATASPATAPVPVSASAPPAAAPAPMRAVAPPSRSVAPPRASVPDAVIASRPSFSAPPAPPSQGAAAGMRGAQRTPPRMSDDLAAQLIREAAARGIYLDRIPSRPWLDQTPDVPEIIEASSHPSIDEAPGVPDIIEASSHPSIDEAATFEQAPEHPAYDDAPAHPALELARMRNARMAAPISDTELAQIAAESGLELESDGRTRERLRFLMWMRRVQAEAGRDDLASVT